MPRSNYKLGPHEVEFGLNENEPPSYIDEDGNEVWYIKAIHDKTVKENILYYVVRYFGADSRTYLHAANDLIMTHVDHINQWERLWGEAYRNGYPEVDEEKDKDEALPRGTKSRPGKKKRVLDLTPTKAKQQPPKRAKSAVKPPIEEPEALFEEGHMHGHVIAYAPQRQMFREASQASQRLFFISDSQRQPARTPSDPEDDEEVDVRDGEDGSEEEEVDLLDRGDASEDETASEDDGVDLLDGGDASEYKIADVRDGTASENEESGDVAMGDLAEGGNDEIKDEEEDDNRMGEPNWELSSRFGRTMGMMSPPRRHYQLRHIEVAEGSMDESNSQVSDDHVELGRRLREASMVAFSQIVEPDLEDDQPPIINQGLTNTDDISKSLHDATNGSMVSLLTIALNIPGLPCYKWVQHAKDDATRSRYHDILMAGIQMLASMDDKVINHLILGNIPQAEQEDEELQDQLRRLRMMGKDDMKPSIYIQYLVDGSGKSPSPRQIEEILQDLELYLGQNSSESHELARKVHGFRKIGSGVYTLESANRGSRKYSENNPDRIAILRQWITAVRQRMAGYNPDLPMSRPFCEVGYATFPISRLTEHKNHVGSNYIMNLVECLFSLRYPQYTIRGYVLFRIFEPLQAMVGEILFTRFSNGYITHGGGFSHYAAGISHAKVFGLQWHLFRKARNQTFKRPNYFPKLDKEVAVLENTADLYRRHRELDAQIENARLANERQEVEIQRLTAESEELRRRALLEHLVAIGRVIDLFSFTQNGPPDT